MKKIEITAFDLASRYIGVKEVSGKVSSPLILSMLQLDQKWPEGDEVPWCSAFTNWICWHLRLPRSKSLMARSWLSVGRVLSPTEMPQAGFDMVILNRANAPQDASILNAPGHNGFYAGLDGDNILVLGGNQSNMVSVAPFPCSRLLGLRRLYE